MKATAPYLFLPLFLLALASLLAGCGSSEPSGTNTQAAGTGQAEAEDAPPSGNATPTILVLGNSLAAGYGLDDPDQGFPELIQQKIDSLGWDFRVVNAGVSGETTAGGLRRIDWLLRQRVDVLVLELGGNDGLRGIATEATRENLQAIIDRTRDRYPDVQVVLAGMQIPPNLGQAYTTRFRDLYPGVSRGGGRPPYPVSPGRRRWGTAAQPGRRHPPHRRRPADRRRERVGNAKAGARIHPPRRTHASGLVFTLVSLRPVDPATA